MNNLPKKQRGMTGTSMMFMLAGICTVVLLVLKITPVYMNHGKVKSAIEGVKGQGDLGTSTKSEVEKRLYARFQINQVTGIDPDNIIITKHGDYVKLEVKYQVEVPLVANMFALMKFDDFVESGEAGK